MSNQITEFEFYFVFSWDFVCGPMGCDWRLLCFLSLLPVAALLPFTFQLSWRLSPSGLPLCKRLSPSGLPLCLWASALRLRSLQYE
jgi:hypothetical protein